jgi:serine-type D-Ala-D-Ala carboxypeptidase (penicillin-binding protein 5/6)
VIAARGRAVYTGFPCSAGRRQCAAGAEFCKEPHFVLSPVIALRYTLERGSLRASSGKPKQLQHSDTAVEPRPPAQTTGEVELNHTVLILVLALVLAIPARPAAAVSPGSIPVKAAIVMDDSGAVLYSKFPNARLAPASTVKLVTAMVVIDSLDPEYLVKISRNAGAVRSIQPRIHADEEMTVSDLLHLALMKSINAAAVALAEATAGSEQDFVVLMNRKAKELGANNTRFANASGLPKGGIQYSTAGDLVLIMRAALSYPLLREILGTKGYLIRTAAGREIFLDNSNDLLWYQNNVIGKTGYTGNARHCFVCAINTEKGPLFTAVLGARSRSSLWRTTLRLAEIGMNPEQASLKDKARGNRGIIPMVEKRIVPVHEGEFSELVPGFAAETGPLDWAPVLCSVKSTCDELFDPAGSAGPVN